MQKILTYSAALLIMTYLGYQVYIVQSEKFAIRGELDEVKTQFNELQANNEQLKMDMEYLSDPHNLEKELRARLNYRSPEEKLIIVVPDEGGE